MFLEMEAEKDPGSSQAVSELLKNKEPLWIMIKKKLICSTREYSSCVPHAVSASYIFPEPFTLDVKDRQAQFSEIH